MVVVVRFLLLCIVWGQLLLCSELPQPDQVIYIPMRDGFTIPCSLYFPNNKPGKYPCILVRQPLGNNDIFPQWLEFMQHGYLVAIQATRSFCDPTGMMLPYFTDGWTNPLGLQDGYDTVQWLAQSEYTNGKIATIGESATGITSLLLAPTAPPNLACQYIEVAAANLYTDAVFTGGQLRKEQAEGWLMSHKRNPLLVQWLKKQKYAIELWNQLNILPVADRIKAPQVHVGGWYDIFLEGTIDAFCAVSKNNPNQTKLIVGPWGHFSKYTKRFGDFEVPSTTPPYLISPKDWFDFHLKGIQNGIDRAPQVQYFVMGPFDGTPCSGNVWKCADSWPPKSVQPLYLFLADNKTLASSSSAPKNFDLSCDPRNPVPTVGGRNLFIPFGPKDLSALSQRDDVLLFTSQPLEREIEVTGRVGAKIYVQEPAHERDLCLRLCDIYPDGRQVLIMEGVAHITPSTRQKKESRILPVYVDLWSTSMVFAPGHRIGLMVSGSNFPAYEKSLDLSARDGNLCFTVCSGGDNASCIFLPCVK